MKVFCVISTVFMSLLAVFMFFVCRQRHICKQTQPYELPFSNEQYASVSDYMNTTSGIEKVETDTTDANNVTFGFANNAYNFDEKSILAIYANNKKVYEGNFCTAIRLCLSRFENTSIHFTVEILYPAKNGKYILYRFVNKSVMYWEREYKIVYACFFPTNQDIDRIHFFPAKYDIIQ